MVKKKKRLIETDMGKIDISTEVDRMDIDDDKIRELSESIREVGLLQAVLLRPVDDRYEIVAGRRRFLACKKLDLSVIDSVIVEMDDKNAAIIRATENLSRENLTPLEEAQIFGNLLNKYEMDYDTIGIKFGYKPGTIRRRMDLLKMPDALRLAVHQGHINVSVAEELWPINDEGDLNYYLSFAIENGCTKATARGWLKDWRSSKRRDKADGVEGGGNVAVNEPRPVYVPCDLCTGPVIIGEETVLRCCDACHKTIKANM